MAKELRYAMLLDLYGSLLTQKQQENLNLYYCEDLSLAEIAQDDSVSRQAVRDVIKRGEQQLTEYEEKLGMLRRIQSCQTALEQLNNAFTAEADRLSPACQEQILKAFSACEEATAVYL